MEQQPGDEDGDVNELRWRRKSALLALATACDQPVEAIPSVRTCIARRGHGSGTDFMDG